MTKSKGSASIAQLGLFDEYFIPIQGFENKYRVSNTGRIISFNRRSCTGKITDGEFEIFPYIDTVGYRSIKLHDGNKGHKYMRLHRLLAIHFIPNPNNYPSVNHIDGNKLNSDLSNLEWCTIKQNLLHARATGLNNNIAELHCNSKLTNKQVLEIVRLRVEENMTLKEISDIFSIKWENVRSIVSGKEWSSVTGIKANAKRENSIGENSGTAKLKCEDVLKIRAMANNTHSCKELANMFNVEITSIYGIVNRKSWKHI